MGVDSINIDLFGFRLSVVSEDPRSSAVLRSALADHIVDQRFDPGFLLRAPRGDEKFFVLLDRSGLVLCRSRTSGGCLASLASHLAACAPPPAGTYRIHARVLVDDVGGGVLAAFPLFTIPTMTERQLERVGHRMVDRLAVDLTDEGVLTAVETPWPELAALSFPTGHSPATNGSSRITRILLPQVADVAPNRAETVALLAAAIAGLSVQDRVAAATTLTELPMVGVPVHSKSARYEALRQTDGYGA